MRKRQLVTRICWSLHIAETNIKWHYTLFKSHIHIKSTQKSDISNQTPSELNDFL
jgi:hypothetical protein